VSRLAFPGRSGFAVWQRAHRDHFGLLLGLLVATFLVTGVNDARWPRIIGAGLNVAVLWTGLLAAGVRWPRVQIGLVAVTGFVGTALVTAFPLSSVGAGIGALGQVAVLVAVLRAVIGRVLAHDRVEMSTILGAIAAYFLIGLIFAWLFAALAGFGDGPVLSPAQDRLPVYYSFVVLTTLGFGDLTPIDEFARRVTAIEAVVGQVFLATLVARLVSLFGQRRPSAVGPDRSTDPVPPS
jgi:hypothetical protein